MIPRPDDPLVVALDVSDPELAEQLAGALAPPFQAWTEIGVTMITGCRPMPISRYCGYLLAKSSIASSRVVPCSTTRPCPDTRTHHSTVQSSS